MWIAASTTTVMPRWLRGTRSARWWYRIGRAWRTRRETWKVYSTHKRAAIDRSGFLRPRCPPSSTVDIWDWRESIFSARLRVARNRKRYRIIILMIKRIALDIDVEKNLKKELSKVSEWFHVWKFYEDMHFIMYFIKFLNSKIFTRRNLRKFWHFFYCIVFISSKLCICH